MIKKLIIFTILILSVTNLVPWFNCNGLKEDFHLSKEKVTLQLDDAIHNDTGVPAVLIRTYHNKPVFYALELSRRLLQYFDLSFLVNLISLAGLIGAILGIRRLGIAVFFVLLLNLAETVFNPKIFFPLKLLMLTIPYYLMSFAGYRWLLQRENGKRLFVIVFIILLLSLWWQVVIVKKDVFNFCQ